MRPVPLYNLKQGMNRLRAKGGASPSSLYDLLNAYVRVDGSIGPREGTIRTQTLTTASKGLMADNGIFNVFSITPQSVPDGYLDNVLVNPNNGSIELDTIWFAKPFMGFPYVVAEFADGEIFHYWLQSSGTWKANTVYTNGTLILPTVSTGFAYQAQRVSAVNPTWTAETAISLNTIVEPTVYNGYQFKAVAVAGATPHTGSSEPSWPATPAATIQEFGDFDTSSTDAGTTSGSTAAPLSQTITDRYGDSETIASAGASAGGTLTIPPVASTSVSVWAPGTLYAPGAVVKPSTNQGGFINAIPNGDFEAGNDGNWILSSGCVFDSTLPYQGTEDLQFSVNGTQATATMNTYGVVTPGQSVTATAYFNPHSSGADMTMLISLRWYDNSNSFISQTDGPHEQNGGYRLSSVTGVAPPNAVRVRVRLTGGNGAGARQGYADLVSWNLSQPAPVSNFLFEAIQASAGSSGSTEPTWPTVAGNTVIDNQVTWKAIGTSIITWEAIPIMMSGSSEPTWPTSVPIAVHDTSSFTDVNGNAIDTSISWITSSRQITDPKNPQTRAVALAASHVFAGDKDIVPFSAAVDPTDWTTAQNAGYLPTGLNNYGDNPVAMLALYRSNLMAFNAGGYQMWQVDPDPANMALLDAQPVGSIFARAAQSVSNDLIFLTEVGVRNLGTVGATANMAVGSSGQPVDPLVKAFLGRQGKGQVETLLHFGGSDGSTSFFDSSPYAKPVTVSPGPTISTADSALGVSSGLFNGNGFISFPSGMALYKFDWTVEFWFKPTGGSGIARHLFACGSSAPTILWNSVTQQVVCVDGLNNYTASAPLNVWTSVAMTFDASTKTSRFYVNGDLINSFVSVGLYNTEPTFYVGGIGAGANPSNFIGNVDEFRFSNADWYNGYQHYVVQTNPFPRADPISLYYPGRGQYWLIFPSPANGLDMFDGSVLRVLPICTAIVFTVNGQGLKTWSRYEFPDVITDWTFNEGYLFFRTWNNKIWQLDENARANVGIQALADDCNNVTQGSLFTSVIQWPYVDCGPMGLTKELIGVDIMGTGSCYVSIGWDESDLSTFYANSGPQFSTAGATPLFKVTLGDTLPGQPIPFPMSAPSFTMLLVFNTNANPSAGWEWQASSLYLNDMRGGGATG